MAMTGPSVVNQMYAQWSVGRQPAAITFLGTLVTGPEADPAVQAGFATLYYDKMANQLCIDNLS